MTSVTRRGEPSLFWQRPAVRLSCGEDTGRRLHEPKRFRSRRTDEACIRIDRSCRTCRRLRHDGPLAQRGARRSRSDGGQHREGYRHLLAERRHGSRGRQGVGVDAGQSRIPYPRERRLQRGRCDERGRALQPDGQAACSSVEQRTPHRRHADAGRRCVRQRDAYRGADADASGQRPQRHRRQGPWSCTRIPTISRHSPPATPARASHAASFARCDDCARRGARGRSRRVRFRRAGEEASVRSRRRRTASTDIRQRDQRPRDLPAVRRRRDGRRQRVGRNPQHLAGRRPHHRRLARRRTGFRRVRRGFRRVRPSPRRSGS